MAAVVVLIFNPPGAAGGPLTALLMEARERLLEIQAPLFRAAGAAEVDALRSTGASFGEALATHARRLADRGLVVLGAGAVARLRPADARRLVETAASGERRALTNNRYSSDVCAVGDTRPLRQLPPLPADNALPRWLEERAGFKVTELPGRERLAFDLDSPLDLALLALSLDAPASLRRLAAERSLAVPRLERLRSVAADPRRELLLAGRSSAAELAWLERQTACRTRFVAEERGLRAASPLALRARPSEGATGSAGRPPRSILGRLLAERGPASLGATIAELADGALIDSRVLLADRLGAAEAAWPVPEERFRSDLLQADGIGDPWLRELTASAAAAPVPIQLGGHTLVGPGMRLLFRAGPSRDAGALAAWAQPRAASGPR